jgi:DNA polymerase III delta prime subunit
MKNLILSENYRPKNINDVILLPRIKDMFKNGITQNMLFYGHSGAGKTTLAEILIGKYSKDKAFLPINGSKDTSVDILRTKIDDFCNTVYMGLDLDTEIKSNDTKYVFIDECEKISNAFEMALKGFITEQNNRNVVFILNTNYINKLSKELKSRFLLVNFDCLDKDEEKYLKNNFYKRVMNVIAPAENIEIPAETLKTIIVKNFPDFRRTLNSLQHFKETGEIIEITNSETKGNEELYLVALGDGKNFNEIYHYLMDKFGADKIDIMISSLGRPFIDYVINNYPNKAEKLFNVAYIITEHTRLLETNTDPIVLGITVLNKIREIMK